MTDLKFINPHLYVGTIGNFAYWDYPNFTYPVPKNVIDPVNTWTFILPYQLP